MTSMPDIAKEARLDIGGTLERVGMSAIELPIRLAGGHLIPARADAFVSLDAPEAKGIHMSRLFLLLQEGLSDEAPSPSVVRSLLQSFIDSHEGLSDSAALRLDFELPLRRRALKSDNVGWRSYPVAIDARLENGVFHCQYEARITYSSTCPCSAALARQLIQDKFQADFGADGSVDLATIHAWLGKAESICATPHSQRSYADVTVVLADGVQRFDHAELIDLVEESLQTPVQAAVKRADEQEFARLNGSNPMFCEDAGRRLKHALNGEDRFVDFRARASHLESLHPHDAVSIVTKGVDGGLRP
jgi:GTP cyclohydrolase I